MNPGGRSLQAVELEARVADAERLAAAGDGPGALAALRQAVDRGHLYASSLLGAWQVLGNIVDADVPAGIGRLEGAANGGESAAAAFLANLYAGGLQVEQDWTKSLDWLVSAARLGNARALTQLALMAHGAAPDPLRTNLLLAAATRDFAPAQYLLGNELRAADNPRHREIGMAWIGTAAQGGDPSARAEAALDQALARSLGPLALEGVDWETVRRRCEPAQWLAVRPDVSSRPLPQVTTVANLIPIPWCHYLISLAAQRLQRATVNDIARGRVVHSMRTNSSANFPAGDSDPLLQLVNHRMAQACGMPLDHQEQTCILHYLPGQSYEDHFDFVDPDIQLFQDELATRGQRVVTVLIYLNSGYEQGETHFPLLHWRYKGTPGDALLFRNVTASGAADRSMLHAGRPPVRGEKWLLSKWVRSRPQPAHSRG
jgi:prolyl 4-hydroxylase